MPTGYTSQIAENNCTFRKFAISCARNFGATIALRDEDGSIEPTPENVRLGGTYHGKRLKQTKAAQTKFKNLSPAQKKKQFEIETQKQIQYHKGCIFSARKLKNQYLEMLERVEGWTPPTKDHVNMKEFMVKQINDSIKFDCGEEYHTQGIINHTLATFNEWKKEKEDSFAWNLEYCAKEMEKETARDNDRSQWVADLIASLPEK